MGPMGPSAFTFIGYKQTDKQSIYLNALTRSKSCETWLRPLRIKSDVARRRKFKFIYINILLRKAFHAVVDVLNCV